MPTLDRDLSIIAQVAAKAATELAAAEIAAGNAFDGASWKNRTRVIFQHIIEVAGGSVTAADPVEALVTAFPGSEVTQVAPVEQASAPVAPAATGWLAANGLNPARLSTSSDNKANEFALIQELDARGTDAFWDNRVNKKNPKGPDLKHKVTGQALWVR
jgi:hypothetical protein